MATRRKRRPKSQLSQVQEASNLLETLHERATRAVGKDTTDVQFRQMSELGLKATFIECLSKALRALEQIDPESARFKRQSPVAQATTAAILIDKATEKIAPLIMQSQLDDGSVITHEVVTSVVRRVKVGIKELEDKGFMGPEVGEFGPRGGGQVIEAPVDAVVIPEGSDNGHDQAGEEQENGDDDRQPHGDD